MKMMKKFAAAVCAAAMAVSSMAALNASAVYYPPVGTIIVAKCAPASVNYRPYDDRYGRSEIIGRHKGNGIYEMGGYYKETGKFAGGKVYQCGDVDLDGSVTADDAMAAMDIASLYLSGLNPLNYGYTNEQCWVAAVTSPFNKNVTMLDAQVILEYVNYKKKYPNRWGRIEYYIVNHDAKTTCANRWVKVTNAYVNCLLDGNKNDTEMMYVTIR